MMGFVFGRHGARQEYIAVSVRDLLPVVCYSHTGNAVTQQVSSNAVTKRNIYIYMAIN